MIEFDDLWFCTVPRPVQSASNECWYEHAIYHPVTRIISEFEEATGKKINYQQVSPDQYRSFLPDFMADMMENHLLIEKPRYCNGMSLQESLDALDENPANWKEVLKNSTF